MLVGRNVDGFAIFKFQLDRNLLPYKDSEIARRMGMQRSNYSCVITGKKPINSKFLEKFYTAFGIELKEGGCREIRRDYLMREIGELNEELYEMLQGLQRYISTLNILTNKTNWVISEAKKETNAEITK